MMLKLVIRRFARCRSAVHGRLWIDGQWVCDTLEYEPSCLAAGDYPVRLEYVESDHRKMMVIGSHPDEEEAPQEGETAIEEGGTAIEEGRTATEESDAATERCDAAPAVIRASNGPFALGAGVAVGECRHLGFLVHCADAFAPLFERVRMSLSRGNVVRLVVRDV